VSDKTAMPEKRSGSLWVAALLITIALFSLYYGNNAFYSDISFDGAIFSQSVVSLARYGVPSNTYDIQDASELHLPLTNLSQGMFSQYILGWPFIELFGVNHFTLQINNLIFLVLGGLLLYLLIVRKSGQPWLGLLGVFLFYTFPRVDLYGIRAFGEVPAFVYSVLSALLLYKALEDRRFFPLLGLSVFLAFHTKHFLVLYFPILLVILIYLWLVQKDVKLRDILYFSAAFLSPILLMHLFFIAAYGWGELDKEYGIIRDLIVSGQWGTLGEVPPFDWGQFRQAINTIRIEWGSAWFFYLPLAAGYALAIAALFLRASNVFRLNLDRRQAVILFLLVVSVFYILYWYHFSIRLIWYRKLMPIMLLNVPLQLISLSWLLEWARKRRQETSRGVARPLLFMAGAVIVFPMLFAHISQSAAHFEIKRADEPWLRNSKDMMRVVDTLPKTARLFGTGWWQAPRVGLYGDRFILNIATRGTEYSSGYLIFDHEALGISPQEVRQTLLRYHTELVHRNPQYELYRFQARDIPEAARRLELSSEFRLCELGPQVARAGEPFYPQPQGNSALWARTENATPTTLVIWDETPLKTHVAHPGHITALVPKELVAQPGNIHVWLADFESGTRSNEMMIQILPHEDETVTGVEE
jgi:hypothetical protein